MEVVRVVLVAATVTSGLLAGVYLFYAHTVMPAVRGLADRPAVDTFAALDRRIVNPVFMATGFLGAPVLTAAAVAMTWDRPARWWVAAALVLHLVATTVTARVHLPRNAAVIAQAAGDERYSATTARVALDEPTWVRWNLVRVAVSVAALTCLAWSLTLT